MDFRGAVLQLADRVRVKDPITNTEHVLRIVGKGFTGARVALTGVIDGHEDTVIDGTFAEWESTTWGSSTELLL